MKIIKKLVGCVLDSFGFSGSTLAVASSTLCALLFVS